MNQLDNLPSTILSWGCLECGEWITPDTGTPHVCPPFNGYSDEDRSRRDAMRAFLCKDDKDQMDRIENMLETLLGKSL